MKTLGIVSLTLSILAASVGASMAQNYNQHYTPTPGLSAVGNSIYGDMPRTHDTAAIVRELNNNGVNGPTDRPFEGFYSPRN